MNQEYKYFYLLYSRIPIIAMMMMTTTTTTSSYIYIFPSTLDVTICCTVDESVFLQNRFMQFRKSVSNRPNIYCRRIRSNHLRCYYCFCPITPIIDPSVKIIIVTGTLLYLLAYCCCVPCFTCFMLGLISPRRPLSHDEATKNRSSLLIIISY